VPGSAGLVRVETVEVARDDGHGHRQRQHSGDGTSGADQLAGVAYGHLVAVSDRCHGDDGPPERVRDAVHLRVVATELGVVDGTGED